MIAFHKKGEFASVVRIGGETANSYWEADGFHDTETRRMVDAPSNAIQLKAEWKAKRKADTAAEMARREAEQAKQDAYFAMDPCERFVKRAMLDFPSIFPTRIKVLEHAFVVLGNGINWINYGDTRDTTGSGAVMSGETRRDRPHVPAYEFPTMSYEDLDADASFRRSYAHVLEDPKTPQEEKDRIEESVARLVEMTKDEYAKKRAERDERVKNIDALIKPDPEAVIRGHYGSPGGILSYQPDPKKFGGYRCCTALYDMPRNVHPSFKAAALEVIDASIRGNPTDPNIEGLKKLRASIVAFKKKSGGEIGYFVEKAPRKVPYRAPKHVFEVKFEAGQTIEAAFVATFGGGEKEAKDIIKWFGAQTFTPDYFWAQIMQRRPHYLIGDAYHERIAGPYLERSKDKKISNKKYAQAKMEFIADVKTFLDDMAARGLYIDPKAPDEGADEVDAWLTEMEAQVTPEEKKAAEVLAAKIKAEKATKAPQPAARRSIQEPQPRDADDHPVFTDETGRRIQYREDDRLPVIHVLVNGVKVRSFGDYGDVVNYAKYTLGITNDTDLQVLYREYKDDYDRRFP